MIYTLTFNPSLDYVVRVEQLEYSSVNRTQKEQIYPGGKGINVSLVLNNLGIETKALGFIAGFTGREIVKELEERNISSDFVVVENGMSRINVKICVEDSSNTTKEETEINGQGPIISESEIKQIYDKIDQMDGVNDMLVLSGSICRGVSDTIYATIVKYCSIKGIKVVVDASGDLLKNTLGYHPFLIKPNIHELEDLFHKTLDNKVEILECAKELHNMGACNVLVSMGGRGALLVTDDSQVYVYDAPQGIVINTVGAGDSAVAGFLAGYLEKNGDYEYALKMAVSTGSASAFSEELATREEVLRLCK